MGKPGVVPIAAAPPKSGPPAGVAQARAGRVRTRCRRKSQVDCSRQPIEGRAFGPCHGSCCC
jgi:hypothetical protein